MSTGTKAGKKQKSRPNYTRRDFLKAMGMGVTMLALPGLTGEAGGATNGKRPNVLFALADDWSWPHASIAGDKVVKTPSFDRVAREGVLFQNAFVAAPTCTPSRGSILAGQWHWRLEEGANLFGTLPAKFEVYPDLLEQAGYHVGFMHKGWAPGPFKKGGRERNPAGPRFNNFKQFLEDRPDGKPFYFWFGSYDPHRKYEWESGAKSGMRIQDISVFPYWPDNRTVRTDIGDYYWKVQRFDRQVGEMLKLLEENGELDNTLVVVSSDNGLPFPRGKANLYDAGTRVPLAVRWGGKTKGGRVVEDFISLVDLAPTFLEAAGLKPPLAMTGRSFVDVLTSGKSGRVDPNRDRVFTGMERHSTWARKDVLGYPMRAVRTREFLYIRNFKPGRWPAGDPPDYRDVAKSPTKQYMLERRNDPKVKKLFELSFGKRPAEELYDLSKDPWQMRNVSGSVEYAEIKKRLAASMMAELTATKDPRVLGKGDVFDKYPNYAPQRRK